MKLSDIPTKKLKRILKVTKRSVGPDCDSVRILEKELMYREIISKRFLSLKALAATLDLPEDYLSKLAKTGSIPFIFTSGQMRFPLAGVVDCLTRLNPKDMDISKACTIYEKLKGIHSAAKRTKR